MNIESKDDYLVLHSPDSFDLKHIFECGQAFRWIREEDSSYTTIHNGKVINLIEKDGNILIKNTDEKEFNEIWLDYFDLENDYSKIKNELSKDEIMKEAIKFGSGLRILKQDKFEMLISFMISANNQIPRIKKSIQLLSKKYGKKIELSSKFCGSEREYYSFPNPEELSKSKISELREEIKVGFRDVRIYDAANKVFSGEFNLNEIEEMSYINGKKTLETLNGIGPKVANCVLLFGFSKTDAFPVDVWVKRIMEYLYFKTSTPNKVIEQFGIDKFGKYSGYAQQYLFYYARENKLGK